MFKKYPFFIALLRAFILLSCTFISQAKEDVEKSLPIATITPLPLLKSTSRTTLGGPTLATKDQVIHKGNVSLSLYNTTLLSSGDKSFSSEPLTTSPINDKITHTIQNEFNKMFKEITVNSTQQQNVKDLQNQTDGSQIKPVNFEEQESVNKEFTYTPSRNTTTKSREPVLDNLEEGEMQRIPNAESSGTRFQEEFHGTDEAVFDSSAKSDLQLETQAFEYDGDDDAFPTLEMRQSECLYSLSEDSAVWRRGTKTLKIVLPHIASVPCVPPLKCKVSTTVNKKVYLQDGDSLKVTLRPPTSQDQTSPQSTITSVDAVAGSSDLTSTKSEAEKSRTSSSDEESLSSTQKAHQLNAREAIEEAGLKKRLRNNFIFKRSFDYHEQYPSVGANSRTSSLTIWKVTESEWSSCSTREGGQVALSDQNGVATIQDTDLPPGTLFFIGRSSWSSSECFKIKVVVRPANCGEGSICSGKGQCYANSSMAEFGCGCCHGYNGEHCEERNACVDGPCLNSGMCVDIQEGHDGSTFQCLCRYGYGGKFCETTTSLCNSQPCKNGGYCEGNHTSYICRCTQGWTGPMCSEESQKSYEPNIESEDASFPLDDNTRSSLSGCNQSPCEHGVCIQTTQKDFRCFCQQGFGGERCEMEYNECDSDPCFNGATCVDQIGSYECLCDRGFTGPLCRIKVDLCSPDPCPMDRACVDKGNSFSCECLQGVTSEDCSPATYLIEQLCEPNPCANGGTCNVLSESQTFFCACRPEFTGLTCQDAFVLESVGPVGTMDPARDVEMRHSPFRGPLTHMRNLYTAAVTLTCAFVIFLIVVSVCHCKINKAYNRCFLPLPKRPNLLTSFKRIHLSTLKDKKRRDRLNSLRFECDPDGASVPMTSQATAENTYYSTDTCDNQELPLIK